MLKNSRTCFKNLVVIIFQHYVWKDQLKNRPPTMLKKGSTILLTQKTFQETADCLIGSYEGCRDAGSVKPNIITGKGWVWRCKYSINPFVPNATFLYPLKILENLTTFWCFQGVAKSCIGNKWVNSCLWKIQKRIQNLYKHLECNFFSKMFDENVSQKAQS